jgi:hypothetical protein
MSGREPYLAADRREELPVRLEIRSGPMPDLPLILWILLGLLAWVLLAVALVLAVVVLPGWSRLSASRERERLDLERRRGDRRIGLPDTRAVRVERRSGMDRRRGPAAMA